ncbi:hypothetical protein GLS40_14770 [Pseudooceanicola sp. 216_PA32_1]|uniref:Uncharacterized protein n=1 Tax=Pseudooceanicola pacificus TaxID=2676438 RepID=A0A844W8S7_9RHOB|nr:hypothetical protein [Pseudooceanicola pacificus]MWB79301.1 hypothetical protein [Pseudooceanicola pacificus]
MVRVLAAIWIAMMILSVAVPALTPATDMGLTRGLNRVMTFLAFQLAAGLPAFWLWALSGRQPGAARRWLARIPGLVALALALGIAALLLWPEMSVQRPDSPPPPPGPVTTTVDT